MGCQELKTKQKDPTFATHGPGRRIGGTLCPFTLASVQLCINFLRECQVPAYPFIISRCIVSPCRWPVVVPLSRSGIGSSAKCGREHEPTEVHTASSADTGVIPVEAGEDGFSQGRNIDKVRWFYVALLSGLLVDLLACRCQQGDSHAIDCCAHCC